MQINIFFFVKTICAGTGKTTVAGAICFGFVHQCRNLSLNSKVIACAFSNVGADNLADQMMKIGLKVVRVGRASSVSEHLWTYTLDAAIDRDPDAQKALENAVKATSNLTSQSSNGKGVEKRRKDGNGKRILEEHFRGLATAAVKASIKVRLILTIAYTYIPYFYDDYMLISASLYCLLHRRQTLPQHEHCAKLMLSYQLPLVHQTLAFLPHVA